MKCEICSNEIGKKWKQVSITTLMTVSTDAGLKIQHGGMQNYNVCDNCFNNMNFREYKAEEMEKFESHKNDVLTVGEVRKILSDVFNNLPDTDEDLINYVKEHGKVKE